MIRISEDLKGMASHSIIEISKKAPADSLDLTVGEPDLPADPDVVEGIKMALSEGLTRYTADEGILELREHICEQIKAKYGLSYSPDEVLITPGGAGSFYAAMKAVTNPRERVALQSPWYPGHFRSLKVMGCEVIPLRSFEEGSPVRVSPEAVPRGVSAIALCSPHNPTGQVLSAEEMEALQRRALEEDAALVVDVTYEELTPTGKVFLPPSRENLLISGSFSKSLCITGLRVGYLAGPREAVEAAKKVQLAFGLCANSLGQRGVLEAYRKGMRRVPKVREEYLNRARRCQGILQEAGIKTFQPDGGFFLFPYVARRSRDVASRLAAEGIVTVPGYPFFGPDGEGHLRIALIRPLSELEPAVRRMAEVIRGL